MLKVEQQHAETFRTQSVLMLLNVIDVWQSEQWQLLSVLLDQWQSCYFK